MNQDVKTISLKIGPYQVQAIPTGLFGLDGGAMFGTVPKVLWEKTNPPDSQNRIAMEARALLLQSDDGRTNILVDCGIGGDFNLKYGDKLGPKFTEMYALDRSKTSLENSLLRCGLKLTDITHVVLTHLHFDHAGGATRAGTTGAAESTAASSSTASSPSGTGDSLKLVPTFPNAKYFVQRRNYETAVQPNVREKASYFAANFQPLMDAGVLTLLDGDVDHLLPGISVIVSDGHTQGQQMVHVHGSVSGSTSSDAVDGSAPRTGVENLVYCGDVIPTSTHVRLPWVMGYDLHPLQLIEEKRRLLTRAAAEGWWLYFEHDPFTDLAKVEALKGDFAISERYQVPFPGHGAAI